MEKIIQIQKLWIESLKKGDPKAQTELYQLFYKSVYNSCYRLLLNKADAEDMMQNTFITAFDKIGSFRGEIGIGAWLKRIAINKCIDWLRAKKIKFTDLDDKNTEQVEDDMPMPDIPLETIENAINQLALGYKSIIVMHLIENMEFAEISKCLRISESSVRSQFARGRKKLQLIINELIKTNYNENAQ